ncbi:MAG: molybdenum cofactor guanylyltransferase, partial [Phycisphaeraceae bacterium]
GEVMVRRAGRHVAVEFSAVTVVADRADKYADLGLRTIADAVPALGPAGGLATALADRRGRGGAGWLWLVTCDLVAVEGALLERMLAARGEAGGAVALRDERWEPMPGLYHTAIEPAVREHLAAGERAMWKLLERVGAKAVGLEAGEVGPRQVNTVTELAAWEAAQR